MLHAVIMAGGSGTRFWPASRADKPKQCLDLIGGKTMMQGTVERLDGLIPAERVLIVTNRRLVGSMREQLPQLPAASVLGEPCKRDTAPCVGLAAFIVMHDDPEAIMTVLPADHVIQPAEKFRNSLAYAAELVQENPERIVTFGIPPSYPAESFGYIERGVSQGEGDGMNAYRVVKFREKPKQPTAEEYLATGRFYWNAGIFVWKAKTILAALEKYEPEMYARLKTIGAAWGTPEFGEVFEREFALINGKSIDYAVLERHPEVTVIEAPYAWDDCGSWRSVARIAGEDAQQNTITGKHLGIRTSGCIIRTSDDHLVVTLGLKDCIVVHTPDATLVANKHDEEAIREVVKQLEEMGLKNFL